MLARSQHASRRASALLITSATLLPGNGRANYGPAEYFTYNTVTTSWPRNGERYQRCRRLQRVPSELAGSVHVAGSGAIYFDARAIH